MLDAKNPSVLGVETLVSDSESQNSEHCEISGLTGLQLPWTSTIQKMEADEDFLNPAVQWDVSVPALSLLTDVGVYFIFFPPELLAQNMSREKEFFVLVIIYWIYHLPQLTIWQVGFFLIFFSC